MSLALIQLLMTHVVNKAFTIIRLHVAPSLVKKPVRLAVEKDIVDFLFKELPAESKMIKDEDGKPLKTDGPLLGLSKRRAIQGVINMAFGWDFEERILIENPTVGISKIDKPDSPAAKKKLDTKLLISRTVRSTPCGAS